MSKKESKKIKSPAAKFGKPAGRSPTARRKIRGIKVQVHGRRTASKRKGEDIVFIPLGPPKASWDALSEAQMLRPITSEGHYESAMKIVEDLTTKRTLTKDQEAYLDSLVTLIEAYEEKVHPIHMESKNPIEILHHLLEANGMNASDLGRLLDNRSLGSKILNGERGLSKAHIIKLAKHFSVNPGLFISS